MRKLKNKVLTAFVFAMLILSVFAPVLELSLFEIPEVLAYPDLDPEEDSIKILITNDVHLGKSGENYTTVATYMEQLTNFTSFGKVDFQVAGSDFIHTVGDPNWERFRDYIIGMQYGGVPLFALRGNHESDTNSQYGVFWNQSSWYPSRWAVKYKGVLFIGLPSGSMGGDSYWAEEVEFLEYETKLNPDTTTILFINEPPYNTTDSGGQNSTERYGYMAESRYIDHPNIIFNFSDFLDRNSQIKLIIHFQNHVNYPYQNNATWQDVWVYGCSGNDFSGTSIPRIKLLKVTANNITVTNYNGTTGLASGLPHDFNYTVSTTLNSKATDNYVAYGGISHDNYDRIVFNQWLSEQNGTLQIIGLPQSRTQEILPDPHIEVCYPPEEALGAQLYLGIEGTARVWNWTTRAGAERTVLTIQLTSAGTFDVVCPVQKMADAWNCDTDFLPFPEGNKYNMTIECKANETRTNCLNFRVKWHQGMGSANWGYVDNDTNYDVTTSWQNFSAIITSPTNAKIGQFQFEFDNCSTATDFSIDRISVRIADQTHEKTEDAYITLNGVQYGTTGNLSAYQANNYSIPLDWGTTLLECDCDGAKICMWRIQIHNPKIWCLNRGIYKDVTGWSTTPYYHSYKGKTYTYNFSYLMGLGGTLRVGSEKTVVTQVGSYINTTSSFTNETMQLMNMSFTPYGFLSTFNLTTTSYDNGGTGNWTIETTNQQINLTFTWQPSDPYVYKVNEANLSGIIDCYGYNGDDNNLTIFISGSGTAAVQVNCTTQGEPSAVKVDGSPITKNYDAGSKICSFNVSLASTKNVEVEWAGAGDTTEPTYSLPSPSYNTTLESQPCEFSCQWQDETGLSHYIFSWNGTGSWNNDTEVAFGGSPEWANVSKTLPSAGTLVGYMWYANDTSNNWNQTTIESLTTTSPSANSVALNSPSNGATSKVNSVNFTYTPSFSDPIQNASLWLNVSASWQRVAWNSSGVINATENGIVWNFVVNGSATYIWNIQVFNSTTGIFAASNRTLYVVLEPWYNAFGHNTTIVSTVCLFYCEWEDGDGLSGYVFGTNVTGSWSNDTWASLGSNPAWANETRTLPASIGVRVEYQWWCNDTNGFWNTTGLKFLVTTESGEGEIEIYSSSVDDTRINIAATAYVRMRCRFSTNSSDCTTGTLYINATACSINGTGWATRTYSTSVVIQVNFTVTGVNVNGWTNYSQLISDPQVVFDRARIYYQALDDSRVNINTNIEFRVRVLLLYDNHAFGSGDTVTANFGALSWDAGNSWFDGTRTQGTVGSYTFQVSSLTEATYGITAFQVNVSNPVGVYDRLSVTLAASSSHVLNNTDVTISWTIRRQYDNSLVTSFSYTLNRNATLYKSGLTNSSYIENHADVVYNYTTGAVTDNTYVLTVFVTNTVTVQWSANPPSASDGFTSIAIPYAYIGVTVASIFWIIVIGIALVNDQIEDLPWITIMAVASTIALFILMIVVQSFSGL